MRIKETRSPWVMIPPIIDLQWSRLPDSSLVLWSSPSEVLLTAFQGKDSKTWEEKKKEKTSSSRVSWSDSWQTTWRPIYLLFFSRHLLLLETSSSLPKKWVHENKNIFIRLKSCEEKDFSFISTQFYSCLIYYISIQDTSLHNKGLSNRRVNKWCITHKKMVW